MGRTLYWVGGTGNWSSAGEWALTSGGAGGAGPPQAGDNIVFDGNSFSANGQTSTVDDAFDINDFTVEIDTGLTGCSIDIDSSVHDLDIYGNFSVTGSDDTDVFKLTGGSGANYRLRGINKTLEKSIDGTANEETFDIYGFYKLAGDTKIRRPNFYSGSILYLKEYTFQFWGNTTVSQGTIHMQNGTIHNIQSFGSGVDWTTMTIHKGRGTFYAEIRNCSQTLNFQFGNSDLYILNLETTESDEDATLDELATVDELIIEGTTDNVLIATLSDKCYIKKCTVNQHAGLIISADDIGIEHLITSAGEGVTTPSESVVNDVHIGKLEIVEPSLGDLEMTIAPGVTLTVGEIINSLSSSVSFILRGDPDYLVSGTPRENGILRYMGEAIELSHFVVDHIDLIGTSRIYINGPDTEVVNSTGFIKGAKP